MSKDSLYYELKENYVSLESQLAAAQAEIKERSEIYREMFVEAERLKSELAAAKAELMQHKAGSILAMNEIQMAINKQEITESENKRLREALEWFKEEYERGERKGYEAKITEDMYKLAKAALDGGKP